MVRPALLSIALMAIASPVTAQERPADAATVRAASKKFQDGERAYRAGDFTLAGDLFEGAYALSPHADALWNAARAWHHAGEKARAANLYSRFLHEAPPNAPDRNSATSALVQLSRQLGKIELQRSTFDAVKVDDHGIDADVLYVVPGRHEVVLQQGEERDTQSVVATAGGVISVAFHKTPVAAAPAVSAPVETPRGWSPTIVWIGAGLTVAAAGFSIWSGIDTLNARADFQAAPSKDGFDSGKHKQLRTNIGWVVTGSLAALTAMTAFVLVDWKSPSARASLSAGPGSVMLDGRF